MSAWKLQTPLSAFPTERVERWHERAKTTLQWWLDHPGRSVTRDAIIHDGRRKVAEIEQELAARAESQQ